MFEIDEAGIRASFVNVSVRERNAIVPPELGELNWPAVDFLGWRDRKQPLLGFIVAEVDDEPVGVQLRQAEGLTRSRPQCSWCEDVTLPNDVVFFSAKLAGAAGRKGDTVGTLACAHFECNVNVRRRPTATYIGFDVDEARRHRIDMLRQNVERFARGIRDSA